MHSLETIRKLNEEQEKKEDQEMYELCTTLINAATQYQRDKTYDSYRSLQETIREASKYI